jgi:hypothetical protein
MKKAQITRKRRFIILITAARRQNLLEKEILFPYSAEEGDNQNTIKY